MSNKIALIHTKTTTKSSRGHHTTSPQGRPQGDVRWHRPSPPIGRLPPPGPTCQPLSLHRFSTTSSIASTPFIQVSLIRGLRIDAPAYITSPYPPTGVRYHKSRVDQKLGFPERREQSSNSSKFQYRLASKVQVEFGLLLRILNSSSGGRYIHCIPLYL